MQENAHYINSMVKDSMDEEDRNVFNYLSGGDAWDAYPGKLLYVADSQDDAIVMKHCIEKHGYDFEDVEVVGSEVHVYSKII